MNWAANCLQTVGGVQIATLRCLPYVFQNIVKAALIFAGAVAVFLIIYAGIRFATSGGDPKNVSSARQIMTYAIIGLVIVLSSFGIMAFIAYETNQPCLTQFTFSC
jgi:Type IV secretion system pilin